MRSFRDQMIENKPTKKEVTLEEKLIKIKKLYDNGAISEDEYKKSRIGILSNY